MRVIYAFPEPLPLERARGVQTAHAVAGLGRLGVNIELYYVPGSAHPFANYGVEAPASVKLKPLSRSLAWPLARIHSNRLFASRLLRAVAGAPFIMLVRHLKLASLLLERQPDIRLVYEAHEVFADTAPAGKREARRAEEARVMRGAAAIIANTQATAARLCALYGEPRLQAVIQNGVERPERLPAKDWARAGRHVIYAGSLFPWKGAGDLVAAAAHLAGCRIELLGGDPDRVKELAASIPSGGAEVVLAGQLRHRETLARVCGACIAVLPNRDDADSAFTSPIKLFEYMAAGCAIVATDLPVFREILAEADAVWARPGDPDSLAAAIQSLARDPERAQALGSRLREKSRSYTWSARAEKVKALLERAAQ